MKTLNLTNSIGRSPVRLASLLITFALGCVTLLSAPRAFGVVPAPDGGYPGGNTAEGTNALFSLTSGIDNTALGFRALYHNTTGNFNTAEGFRSLFNNTTGANNTATGVQALFSNTIGGYNTALGVNTLYRNTTGFENTATGTQALLSNTIGHSNTATGTEALFSNTIGHSNTAVGKWALQENTTGESNTANGYQALANNTTGSFNTALGQNAGLNVTTANNVICIGTIPGANVNNSCYIGSIFGSSSVGGSAVYVNSAGKLGTNTSSRRFKEQIKPMDKASEVILALKPVTFHYKKGIDPQGIAQFGLVAEEVEKVNPDLVVRDKNGDLVSVRYEVVNAMLLNEFLKAYRRIEEQDKRIDQLTAQLKEQALLIQKVNDKVELNRLGPQTVADDQ